MPVINCNILYLRKEMARKVEFDFDAISVLGLKFNLPKGGAAKIGSSTGLGSDNNENLIDKGNNITKKKNLHLVFTKMIFHNC
jgi:hypothetical protein